MTEYSLTSAKVGKGILYDTSVYDSVTREIDKTETTTIPSAFGVGVVQGSQPGVNAALPNKYSTIALFEGVIVASPIIEGKYQTDPSQPNIVGYGTLTVLKFGVIGVVLTDTATVAYGTPAYLVIDGVDAGKFTDSTDMTATKIAIPSAKFVSENEDGLALLDLKQKV